MIKVVHFVASINLTNGVTNMLMNYYRFIDRTKVQFDFIYFIDELFPSFRNEIEKLGGQAIKVVSPTHYLKFYKQLCNYFDAHPHNQFIFHNHQIAFTALLKPITSKYKIRRFIVHNHMTKYSDKLISSIRNWLMCMPIRFLDVDYFACSKEAAISIFGKKQWDRNAVTIINNGIDCSKYCFKQDTRNIVRKKLGIENCLIFGHVGHFNIVKNHKFIVEIFRNIANEKDNAFLLLVGTGPLKQQTEKLIRQYALEDKVIILENRDDIPALMNAMDVFLFPSLFEGLGIAAIEAQATGLPVIMSDTVPKAANIHNCTILSLNESASSWGKKALESYVSPELRATANRYVEESDFNIRRLSNHLQTVYEEMARKTAQGIN